MSSPIEQAIRQICDEKGLSYEAVLDTIQAALAAAYRKDFGEKSQNIQIEFNPATGEIKVYDVKTVVEDVDLEAEAVAAETARLAYETKVEEALKAGQNPAELGIEPPFIKRFNPKTEIMISAAREKNPEAQLGDVIRESLEIPAAFGRMAAQTAKQVIMQKLREAERELIYNEFKAREGEIITGTIGRREKRGLLIDLGKTTAIMPLEEQIPNEYYTPGSRLKVYLSSVTIGSHGPELIVSRAHPEMVREIFAMEIPEVASRVVEIKAIAREAGSRSKVAVWTADHNIDPIGSCIGQRGSRIQTIIAELGGEKIDLVSYSDDTAAFISNALAPAKVTAVELNEAEKTARVKTAPDQYSLAIGRGGQNVRLAAKLTGWHVTVEAPNQSELGTGQAPEVKEAEVAPIEATAAAEAETVPAPTEAAAAESAPDQSLVDTED